MAQVQSTMRLALQEPAPGFTLPSTNHFGTVTLKPPSHEIQIENAFSASQEKAEKRQLEKVENSWQGLVVAFLCNHCPFVKHLAEVFSKCTNHYLSQGVSVLAISSNSVVSHPADGPERMAEEAAKWRYPFPYLYDETQAVAKSYYAACTPDFFLFNRHQRLVYRGQFDGSRPSNSVPVTGQDLTEAVEGMLLGRNPVENQLPSVGCNIKWKPGNEPSYY